MVKPMSVPSSTRAAERGQARFVTDGSFEWDSGSVIDFVVVSSY